jgi:hypothetical protein
MGISVSSAVSVAITMLSVMVGSPVGWVGIAAGITGCTGGELRGLVAAVGKARTWMNLGANPLAKMHW